MRITAPLFALLAFAGVGLGSCATAPAAAPPPPAAEENVYRLLAANRIDEAIPLIRDAPDYDALVDIRARREFQVLWSDPRLPFFQRPETMAAHVVANARAAYAGNPTDFEAAYILIRALRDTKQHDEAIQLGRQFLPPLPPANQRQAFLRQYVADAYSGRGEYGAADALMAPLVELSLEERPFLVNQYINHALALLFRGRYEEALRLANRAAAGRGTPYAVGLAAGISVCALHRLNRGEDAQVVLARFPETGAMLYGKRSALLCLNQRDAAARATIQIFSEPGGTSLLAGLHDCASTYVPPASTFAREYAETVKAVRDRPDVRRAIDAVGVILTLPTSC